MHSIISEAEYRKQLQSVAGKAFLLFGDEDYLKAVAVRLTREALCPDPTFAVFNDITIDGTDYTADKLLDAMTPPPMMADTRLIVLRGLDFTAMRANDLDTLIEVLAQLEEFDYNTILVHVAAGLIDEGRLPKSPSTVLKKLSEVATPVRFEASTDAKLAAWAGRHFAHLGITVSPALCNELIAYTGKSMFVLANEIEKISCYVLSHGRATAESADIYTVAAPNASVDAFALSNALLAGKCREALEALGVIKFERVEPTIVMGEISKTLSEMLGTKLLLSDGKSAKEIAATFKMHEYRAGLYIKAVSRVDVARLGRAVELAAEADAALKQYAADYAPIERLICTL